MVRRVLGFYLLRSIYGELRDRSHHTIVYFDLSFLHCLEDTKRYKDKATGNWVLSQVIKIRLIGNCFFGLEASLLHLVFGLVFCSLWFLWVWVYWGREKREKEKSAVILRSASFSFCLCLLHCIPSNESFCRTLRVRSLFLPVLYRIQRVLAFRLWAQRGRLKFLNDHLRIFLCINRGSI